MAGRFRPRRRGLVALSAAAGLLVVGWLATTPWLVDHWPRVLAVVLFLLVFVVPRWFVPARSRPRWQESRTRRPGAGWRTTG
jgi:small-conductance mechanosensitive channel